MVLVCLRRGSTLCPSTCERRESRAAVPVRVFGCASKTWKRAACRPPPPGTGQSQAITTLSLYNSDPFDSNDPFDPVGYRLIGQADSALQSGGAQLEQRLAQGTYYVAVSGSGNHYFHPFVADSGRDGAT